MWFAIFLFIQGFVQGDQSAQNRLGNNLYFHSKKSGNNNFRFKAHLMKLKLKIYALKNIFEKSIGDQNINWLFSNLQLLVLGETLEQYYGKSLNKKNLRKVLENAKTSKNMVARRRNNARRRLLLQNHLTFWLNFWN